MAKTHLVAPIRRVAPPLEPARKAVQALPPDREAVQAAIWVLRNASRRPVLALHRPR